METLAGAGHRLRRVGLMKMPAVEKMACILKTALRRLLIEALQIIKRMVLHTDDNVGAATYCNFDGAHYLVLSEHKLPLVRIPTLR